MPVAKNPFTPSFGKVPPIFAGRQAIIEDISQAFENGLGDPNLASILVGARGTGKTALLSLIASEASQRGWIHATTSALPGMLDDILQQTLACAGSFLDASPKRKLTGLEVGQILGIQWDIEHETPANWRAQMNRLLDSLGEKDVGLLITVDEVKPELDELKTLVSVYQHFVGEERQVALIMAGLPYKVSLLLNDDDISFLRRARKVRLGRIPNVEVRAAFEDTIYEAGKSIDADALDAAVEAIGGFAYMMQLVGYWIWRCSKAETICFEDAQRGIALANEDLRDSVLDSTWNDMSAVDRKFVSAMLEDAEESSLADIAWRMGVKSNYASRYKRRLLEQGVIGEYGTNNLRFEIPSSRAYFAERLGEGSA